MKFSGGWYWFFAALILCAGRTGADVRLPAIFSEHMVLQRSTNLPVWGWASPGEKVIVRIGSSQESTNADALGKWRVTFASIGNGQPMPMEMVVSGSNTITIQDVLPGEVWLCAGQSNMQWPVRSALDATKEIADADFPQIRLFKIAKKASAKPEEEVAGKWVICSPKTVGEFSAVGYFFGRELHRSLKVPIGLIEASWMGSSGEAWVDAEVLRADALTKPIIDRFEMPASRPAATAEPARQTMQAAPASIYNGMIRPLMPLAMKGVAWYHGETSVSRAYQYRTLLSAQIRSWRREWGLGDFSFLIVQLPNFGDASECGPSTPWAEMREAQFSVARALPKCGLAVTIDLGEAGDIHPRNKQDVGKRLSLAALRTAYGSEVFSSGPIFKSATVEGNRIIVQFEASRCGLVAKNGKLSGFAVAAADQKFVPAEASIVGQSVVVSSTAVAKPIAVRYAWGNNPPASLYNTEGLPAVPFRSDDWVRVTADAR